MRILFPASFMLQRAGNSNSSLLVRYNYHNSPTISIRVSESIRVIGSALSSEEHSGFFLVTLSQ